MQWNSGERTRLFIQKKTSSGKPYKDYLAIEIITLDGNTYIMQAHFDNPNGRLKDDQVGPVVNEIEVADSMNIINGEPLHYQSWY